MIIMLQVTSGQALGDSRQKSFDQNGGSFGRASHNAWVLPDDSKTVSGQHGMIYFEGGNFYLTDISTNGIFVNGSDSPLGKGNVTALRDGDSLRFGEYEVKVSGPLAEDNMQPVQQPGATESSAFETEAEPQQIIPSPVVPAPASFENSPGDIESPNFDPLASETMNSASSVRGSSGGAGPTGSNPSTQNTGNPFGANTSSANPAMPDSGYQHSSPMNDPFSNQAVNSDPALATPAGQNQGSEIPEDWDLTGFSKADAGQSPVTGAQPEHYIPEDEPLFDEPDSNAQSSSLPPTGQLPSQQPQDQKTFQQTASPAIDQPAPGQNTAPPLPAQIPIQTGSIDGSYQAFMQGLGLQSTSLNSSQDPLQLMTSTGRLFREVIEGLMILLQARSELKSQFRMSATTIRPTENNPLKFSPNVDEALKALFADERTGYLQSDAAIKEGIRDIRNHQMAMIAGMQSAFTALIQRLNPEQFSADGKDGGVKASILSGGKKSRAWEQYCDYYENIVVRSGNAFQLLFGEDFNKAYEEQLRILESSKE